MALSPQWLDELRSRVTLSSVIMRTTKLQKAGHEWKACCPFHDEKSPSFTVNDSKAFYHCFGCQAHGDVISWMTDQRGMSFMDAVKELAAEAGMEVPAADPQQAARAEQRAGLHDVMQSAQDWFAENLQSNDGAGARDYLKSRGFDAHTIARFGFGYALTDRQAMKSKLSQFEEAMLIEGGLRIAVEDKEPYDRFRSRLMLPIQDARGRVIGFGGRILETGSKAPKYLNSPDTPLFDKGRNLYNLHRASPASRQTNRVVVVEGYMDVIALACAGIEDAVAPMGTALTDTQIEMLWRMVETPVLCFDGDAAGQRAAMRAISRALPMLRPAHSLLIARLPSGVDPDDLLRDKGRVAMDEVLQNAETLLDTVWAFERDAQPLRTPEDKAGLKERLLGHVDTIGDSDIRALYKRELLSRFSDFAFPPREFSKSNVVQGRFGNASGDTIGAPRPEGEVPAVPMVVPNRDAHLYRRLGNAITAGILKRPSVLTSHIDDIIAIEDRAIDNRIMHIIDNLLDDESLTLEDWPDSLRKAGMRLPEEKDWDFLPFPFVKDGADEERAQKMLNNALTLYAGLPRVWHELAKATKMCERDLSQGAWDLQQRLLKQARQLSDELRETMSAAA